MSSQNLDGKVALVTGASSGIGKASAIALADAGASVVLAARSLDKGEAVAEQIRSAGARAVFVQTDVTRDDQLAALVAAAESEFGGLDIAFNNAGTEGTLGPLADADPALYDTVFDTNVRAIFNAIRHQIPALRRRGGGVIINTTSILGLRGVANFSTYVASKFAVEGYSRSLALELAPDNIRVNTVAPGPILTPMHERATNGNPDGFNALIPMRRAGRPEEVADAVLFLASDASRYITGHALPVGGGATAGFVTG
jgi:NAD(P)-dependent dehydrogenase (short-subunit alcohol dehydrogenase family)